MLKTSLLITGDTDAAVKQVDNLATSVDALGKGAKAAAPALGTLEGAQAGVADSSRDAATAVATVGKAQVDAAATGKGLASAQDRVTAAQAATALSSRNLAVSLQTAKTAQVSTSAEIGRSASIHSSASAAAIANAAANDNVARSAGTASTANIVLQSVIRKTVDQYAAGASIGVIFGEHIESLVEILELYARSSGHTVEATKQIGAANEQADNSTGELGKTIVEGAEKFKGFKGVVGVVAEFLSGPWGIAVSLAAAVLPSLIGGLLETESAEDKAKAAAERFAAAQVSLAAAVDQSNGKLAEQNRLQALAGSFAAPSSIRDSLKSVRSNISDGFDAARSTLSSLPGSARTPSGDRLALTRALANAGGGANEGTGNLAALTKYVNEIADSSKSEAVQKLAEKLNALYGTGTKTIQQTREMIGQQRDANTVLAGGTVLTAAAVASQIQLATAHDGVTRAQAKLAVSQADLNRLFSQPSSDARDKSIAKARDAVIADTQAVTAAQEAAKKKPKPKKPADTTAFTAGVQNDIASLTAEFSDAPTFVEKARAAVARLDKDIAELQKKKPPNFQTLIDQATAAKAVIQTNLTKPLDDYIKAQNASFGILKLQAAGLTDQAAAQEQINSLEKQQGTLNAAQRDAVLAGVQAIRAEQRELQIRNELNEKYVTELGSIKTTVQEATQDFVRGDLGQFIKTPGKLIDAFQTVEGQKLFDKLFDGAFRDLQDQVNGTSIVKDAAKRFAIAVDDVTVRSKATAEAVASFRSPVEDANKALGGFVTALQSASATVGSSAASPALTSQLAQGNGVTDPSLVSLLKQGNNTDNSLSVPGDIIVTARTLVSPASATQKPDILVSSLQKMTTSITGLFTNQDSAARIGASIGKYAGKGLEGAATGSMIAGLGKSLGINLSQSGAQVGGAVGGLLSSFSKITSAIPVIGSALGPVLSVVGGLIGTLFKAKTNGSASIAVDASGTASATGATGANATLAAQAKSLAGGVSTDLNQVAQQLGGVLQAVSGITIGVNNGNYHVNAVGGVIGQKGSGDVNFDKDQDAAVAYALQQEVAKGAITGLSAAVSKALQSSTDINAALKEAVNVENLQLLLGGAQAAIKKTIDTEAAAAKERLRLAQAYGLSIVAVEKTNAEQMAKVVAATLKEQVGSLQTLVSDLTSGSLFEGTAIDKIAAINAEITKAKADLDAGVDGAADTLAKLYQDKLTASKDAYGTTSAYAADRTATLDDARAAIARANAQIAAAQTTSDPALATTNAALDENNDQNAQILAALKQNNLLLGQFANGAVPSKAFNLGELASV